MFCTLKRKKGFLQRSKTSESRTTSSACGLTGAGHCNGILPILPVKVKCAKGNRVIETYAFLDPGSTGTFCIRKLVDRLNMEGRKFKIHIRTLGHNDSIESSIVDSLEISGLSGESFYPLPKVFTQKEMPVSTANIISERELRKWHDLDNVNIQHINADVDLLIGTNASKLMEPWEVINSREGEDGPYAIRTLLGWVINGPLGGSDDCGSDHPSFCANRIAIDHIEETWPTFPVDTSVAVDDPEVKRSLTVNAVLVDTNATSELMTHFSDWQRLKVAVVWLIKLKGTLLKLSKKRKELELASTSAARAARLDVQKEMQAFSTSLGNQKVTLEDLLEAEASIIAFCQQERFPTEFAALTSGKPSAKK